MGGQLVHICICIFEKSHCILSDPSVDDQLLPLFSQTITTAACAATWRTKQSQCNILFVLWIVSQIFGNVYFTLWPSGLLVLGGATQIELYITLHLILRDIDQKFPKLPGKGRNSGTAQSLYCHPCSIEEPHAKKEPS